MESTSCLCSSSSPSLPFPSGRFRQRRRSGAAATVVYAAKRDHERVVDENLIVLRKRVHQMKMVERNYEPPADWADWEKQYYTCYDDYICTFVGLLQAHLMNARPSVALGILAVLTMSVPATTVMIVWRLMEITNGALSTVHLFN